MGKGNVVPIVEGAARRVERADREELLRIYDQYRSMGSSWLRRLIVERDRIDLLASVVLGYQVEPFHLAMLRWQFLHPSSLILAFRGAGKTSLCTITKAIHLLCKNRDFRILLASKSARNATSFLKEIKGHLETNERLVELFGPFYDPHRVVKWDNSEIEVLGRTRPGKEASITCVGADSTVVSKHYDAIIDDDLVDEDNSRTRHMREKIRTWAYQTLDPCLEPPDPRVPHRGEHHRQGTRYHFDDYYGHLMANELKHHTLVIPALDDRNRSPWPAKYPPRWFFEKKQNSGTIIFNAQYMNDTEAMKGEIFQYDDCQQVGEEDYPDGLKVFMAADLAATEDKKNDQFAVVTIGVLGKVMCGRDPDAVFVLDYYAGHLRFAKQKAKLFSLYDKWDPLMCGIEANAYQTVLYSELKEQRKSARFTPIHTERDKIVRGWKLSGLFEAKKVFFRKGLHGPLIDQLVLFPNFRYDDLFDALDLAVAVSRKRRRKKRSEGRREPGLI